MSQQPEVSVIMASCNSSRYIEAAIKSVQEQSLRSWELLIVDDASADDSAALAVDMSRRDARIRIIRLKNNRGPAAARNAGIAASRGRWLAMFDSDDLMLPQRLETLLDRAEADRTAIVADNQVQFSETGRKQRLLLPRHTQPCSVGFTEFVNSSRLYSRSPDLGYLKPFVHAATLKRLGIDYDESLRIGEDYHFMAQLLATGLLIRVEPQPLYLYRGHEQSISYRLNADNIVALIKAEDRLARRVSFPTPEKLRAVKRRRHSLESMLKYDHVVNAIKAGQYSRAAELAIGAPFIWPLLTRPLRARAGRLVGSLRATARGAALP
jgi:succinoglycan biosynthesis protein ExoO